MNYVAPLYQPERLVDALKEARVTHGAGGRAKLRNVRLGDPKMGFGGMFYCAASAESVSFVTPGDGGPLSLPLEVEVDPSLISPPEPGIYDLSVEFATNGRTCITIHGCEPALR